MNRAPGAIATIRVALTGLGALLTQEKSARIHLVVTMVLVVAALGLGFDRMEWLWLIVALAQVWSSEAFNTAIERLGDSVSLDHHPQIGFAKDIAAAGVLLCLISATLICAIIFWPHLFPGIKA